MSKRRMIITYMLMFILMPAYILKAKDLTIDAVISTELHPEKDHPKENLFDGNESTFFAHMRLDESYWRIHFKKPAYIDSVTFVQGWTDWAQAEKITVSNSSGESVTLTLANGHDSKQRFAIPFNYPTDYLMVKVDSAITGISEGEWGGFAEMGISGTFHTGDIIVPMISDWTFNSLNKQKAQLSWTSCVPTRRIVSFSTDSLSHITMIDTVLRLDHELTISGYGVIRGLAKVELTDSVGNSSINWYPMSEDETLLEFGIGDGWFNVDNGWIPAWEMYERDDMDVDVIKSWVGTPHWRSFTSTDWIRQHVERGYKIQFLHFFFGDWPTIENIKARQKEFMDDLRELADTIAASGCDSAVMITLEPEYNQADVASWDGWNDVMIEAMDMVRSIIPNVEIGLIAGDWDFEHVIPISMGRAARKADYVAFQEMRASTRNTPEETYGTITKGLRFANYLRDHFRLPIRWDYLYVSDYNGWEDIQSTVVTELFDRIDEVKAANIIGVNWMAYMNDPQQADGYYGKAEAHKGLKDEYNNPKAIWSIWKDGVAENKDKQDKTYIDITSLQKEIPMNITIRNQKILIHNSAVDLKEIHIYQCSGKRISTIPVIQHSDRVAEALLPIGLASGLYLLRYTISRRTLSYKVLYR